VAEKEKKGVLRGERGILPRGHLCEEGRGAGLHSRERAFPTFKKERVAEIGKKRCEIERGWKGKGMGGESKYSSFSPQDLSHGFSGVKRQQKGEKEGIKRQSGEKGVPGGKNPPSV